ncbi:MAG: hypothetical protein E6H10_07150 [Bacteroidetes bacterium]|nr:MAG: hypothetical protein E6H10_07150 [Bacteroidota bacterium]
MTVVKILLKLVLASLLTLVCVQYFVSKHYNYAYPSVFKGKYLYNPYDSLKKHWWKSNFHAHSIAWHHLPNGHQSPKKIIAHYKKDLKYDIACLSNYEKRTHYLPPSDPHYIPVYEHGYNIGKVHQLVFGRDPIVYYDIALFQTLDNKQYIINEEKQDSDIVVVAHPEVRDAYSRTDMEKLSGYDMLEVLNNKKIATRSWDEALSSGKPAWIIADDDCHDISKPGETGVSWTMVNAETKKCKDVMEALRCGRSYGVKGSDGVNDHYLKQVTVKDTVVTFVVDDTATEIKLFGQNGILRKAECNTDSISYTFKPTDTYIRAVAEFPSQELYLNAIIRYDGKHIPHNNNTASVNFWRTLRIRAVIIAIWIFGMTVVVIPSIPVTLSYFFRKRRARELSLILVHQSGI